MTLQVNTIVKSKIHDDLTTWVVDEITTGVSGKKLYFCSAKHDTKHSRGFDKISREFNESELELF
jgi:hypothetical protein